MAIGIGPGDLPAGPLTKGLQVIFQQAYDSAMAASILPRICTIVSSNSDSEDYSWLGDVPQVREFLGERQARDLANFNYNIRNKTWENTLGIKRSDLEDQKFDMINMRIRGLAEEAARYKEQLVMEFLTGALGSAAAPYLCYDGQGLIDTDHPAPSDLDGAVQSNRAGTALASATLWVAITAMRSFQSDTGRVLNASPDLLVVEPCLEQTARELLCGFGTTGVSATAKVIADLGIDLHVSPYLYSTATAANGNWFLMDTKSLVKPVIFQEREAVEFGALEATSDTGFLRDQYIYGTRARYNVGAGAWFRLYGNAGAG